MRQRIKLLLIVGAATLASETIGMLTGPYPWLMPPVMAGLTLVIVWVWHATMTGPPGPINTMFAAAFGAYMATHGHTISSLIPITAFAWFTAALASVLILALDVHAPEREAVDAADAAVSAYRDRPDDTSERVANRMRSHAYNSVHEAWRVLRIGRNRRPLTATGRDLEDHLMGIHLNLIQVLQSESFPASSLAIGANFRRVPMGRPPVVYLLKTAMQRGSRPWLVALRATLAVLLASTMMIASPVGHSYWAILSALIVLHMGASRADMTIRAAHRVVGTGIGVMVYFAIIALHPSDWAKVVIVIAAIYGLEAVVTRNYALAVVFITTFALMMTPIGSTADITTVMRDRFVETVIGVSAAVLMIWLVGGKAPVLLVRSQYRRTLGTMIAVLGDLAAGTSVTRKAREDRRNMVFELERASAILSSQRPDDPEALSRWQGVQEHVNRFGYDVMAACWRELPPGGDAPAGEAHQALADLVNDLPPISSKVIDATGLAQQITLIHRNYLIQMHRQMRAEAER